MSLLHRAIRLAVNAHEHQVDKAGKPYILHPLRVMLACETEEERVVAVLHDVVEDTHVSLWALRLIGFGDEIIAAVDAITRRKDESANQYYARVKANRLATRVKVADFSDNMDISRIPEMTPYWADKIRYYQKMRDELLVVLTEEQQDG